MRTRRRRHGCGRPAARKSGSDGVTVWAILLVAGFIALITGSAGAGIVTGAGLLLAAVFTGTLR